MAVRFGFGKAEKLKSRKQIEELFLSGKSFGAFPLRIIYRAVPAIDGIPVKVGVTASKKYYKRAVDRNRLKRLIREAYRLQKDDLVQALKASGKGVNVFFVYSNKEQLSFAVIKEAVRKGLIQLQQRLLQDEINT